jgi:hypothetical protein
MHIYVRALNAIRLLQLNKDNEELREKRTTLEALLVLEREDMADLQKAHTDLQANLVELATEKQQLVYRFPSTQPSDGDVSPRTCAHAQSDNIAQLKELAAQSQLEKSVLSSELKTLVSSLQETDKSHPQAKGTRVITMHRARVTVRIRRAMLTRRHGTHTHRLDGGLDGAGRQVPGSVQGGPVARRCHPRPRARRGPSLPPSFSSSSSSSC